MRRSLPCVLFVSMAALGCQPADRQGGSGGSGGSTSASGGQAGGKGGSGSGGAASGGNSGSGGASQAGGSLGSGGTASGGAGGSLGDAAIGNGGAGGDTSASTGGAKTDAASGGAGGGTAGGSSAGGRTGAGGGTGTGGTTGTGGSTAPTPCTFPSSWTVGGATYTTYSLPNPITACGYNGTNNTIKNIVKGEHFAAIPGKSSSDFDTSNRCGACIQIGSAVVTIVDECPYDGNNNPPCKANPSGHMDLSNAAASAGGVRGDPAVRGQNQWKYIPCPVTGNVIVRLKPGNNNEMFVENIILPLKEVTCAGMKGSRTSYGAWHFDSNMPGATCELTDIAGRTVTVTAGSTQGQDVDTKVQFPKCL